MNGGELFGPRERAGPVAILERVGQRRSHGTQHRFGPRRRRRCETSEHDGAVLELRDDPAVDATREDLFDLGRVLDGAGVTPRGHVPLTLDDPRDPDRVEIEQVSQPAALVGDAFGRSRSRDPRFVHLVPSPGVVGAAVPAAPPAPADPGGRSVAEGTETAPSCGNSRRRESRAIVGVTRWAEASTRASSDGLA